MQKYYMASFTHNFLLPSTKNTNKNNTFYRLSSAFRTNIMLSGISDRDEGSFKQEDLRVRDDRIQIERGPDGLKKPMRKPVRSRPCQNKGLNN